MPTLNPRQLTLYEQDNVVIDAAATQQDVRVAPGANKQIVVTYARLSVETAAAQATTLQDDSGTVILLVIPASATGQFVFESAEGVELTVNEKLELITAGAGPRVRAYVESYVKGQM